MSNLNRLIDLIVKDRMMVCNCTDDRRKCIKCQYEDCRLPEQNPEFPTFERVPEGVFVYGKYSRDLYYPFGNGQILAWDNSCYCVYRDCCKEAHIPFSPYLIPSTFGDLKPGEWFADTYPLCKPTGQYGLLTTDGQYAMADCGGVKLFGHCSTWKIYRVSEAIP